MKPLLVKRHVQKDCFYMSSLSTNFRHVAFCRNEELNTKLKHEIQKLNRMVANPGANTLGSEGDPSEVSELRVRQITYSAGKKEPTR